MKIRILFTLLACLVVPHLVVAAEAVPAKDRLVVLLSIDGFPSWLWKDPAMPIPNLRRLAAEGAVGEAMTVSNPSITWINHTTLVTGVSPRRHGVLFNGLLVRQGPTLPPKIEQWAERDRMVFAPTIYDRAFAAGLTTAEVDWVAITKAPTIHWSFPELPDPEGVVAKELQLSRKLWDPGLGMSDAAKSRNIAWRDLQWTQAAVHIVQEHRPNLLLFHLLSTDASNHSYGPGSTGSYVAYGYIDQLVGRFVEGVRDAGLLEKTTILVATDHGFKKVAKVVLPNVALRKAGLLEAVGPRVTKAEAWVQAQGGMAFAYVNDPARKAELLPRLREVLSKLEGVERVLDGSDGPGLGMPLPEENAGMGDLILFAKKGYAFQLPVTGENEVVESNGYLGTHGYPASDPELDGVLIASGYGIRKGVTLGRVSNLDVTPTLSRLLGVESPGKEGRVLEEFLAPAR
jgi:predicted AlkP superfamily pyrophosphatase or phosphodiesterase